MATFVGKSSTTHYAQQLCDVLAYLHQQKPPIIFRDVKPTNIMLAETGHIFLIDFGIARFFKEGQRQDTEFLGSRGYASPEQHGFFQTTPRADIYSLGATLHFCLTGQDPYHAADPFVFSSIQQSNPQVPSSLALLIHRMVAVDEQLRPTTMLQIQQALSDITRQAMDSTTNLILPPQLALGPIPHHSGNTDQTIFPSYPSGPQIPTSPAVIAGPKPAQLMMPPTRAKPSASEKVIPSPTESVQSQKSLYALFIGPGLLLIIIICITSMLLSSPAAYNQALTIEPALAFFLWLVTAIGYKTVKGFLSRSMLAITSIAAFIAGGTLLFLNIPNVLTQVQNLLAILLSPQDIENFFRQPLTFSLMVASIISLGWPLRIANWAKKLVLLIYFSIATICILLQANIVYTDTSEHILLPITLIALIQGVLTAIYFERQRKKRPPLKGKKSR